VLLRDTLDDLGWADALDETAAGANPSATPARPGAAAAASSSRSVLRDAVARLEAMSSRAQDLVFEVRTFVRLFVRSFVRLFVRAFVRALVRARDARSKAHSLVRRFDLAPPFRFATTPMRRRRTVSFRHDSYVCHTGGPLARHRRTVLSRGGAAFHARFFGPRRRTARGVAASSSSTQSSTRCSTSTRSSARRRARRTSRTRSSRTRSTTCRSDAEITVDRITFSSRSFCVSRVSPERAPPEPAPWIVQSQPEPDPDPTPSASA
jgi:hypothetical protein